MEDEPDNKCCSSTNSSSTCIANDLEKKWSNRKIKSSYSYRGKSREILSGDQNVIGTSKSYENCHDQLEQFCHVTLESILKLKASTKQLIYLLEEIQTKINSKHIPDDTPRFSSVSRPLAQDNAPKGVLDDRHEGMLDTVGLRKLKNHTKYIDAIFIEEERDDCSVYRRLTRKCHCLNHPDYNDFVIHFNEDSKHTTSNLGEIIKNMRILRKFLYMGGNYTRNSLMFLNEGMMESPHSEKVEMTQACAHADVCNVFDDHSIVIVCISWPCKNKHYGDYVTQALAAGLLYKLAELEEGRRYLNYSTKIVNDIKKVLRKRSTCIEIDTIESLNATLDLLKPVFAKNVAITYYNKSVYEGVGKSTINDLINNRQYMTLDEIFMNLELLKNYSAYDSGRTEMMLHLPVLLILLKHLLMEYDNSEINIMVTNILNNMVSKHMVKTEPESSNTLVLAETATEAIHMKNVFCQIPLKKCNMKKIHKSKCGLGVSPNKFRQQSKRKDSEWEPSTVLNKSKKFKNEHLKSIIFVPIEK